MAARMSWRETRELIGRDTEAYGAWPLLFGVTIGNHVRAGGGLYFAHGHIVMDGHVRLGSGVEIAPFVTLGLVNSARHGFTFDGPTVGDGVNI